MSYILVFKQANPNNTTGLVICYVCGHALQLFIDQRGVLLPSRERPTVCALHTTFSNTTITSTTSSRIGGIYSSCSTGSSGGRRGSGHIAQHLLCGTTATTAAASISSSILEVPAQLITASLRQGPGSTLPLSH